MHISRVQLVNYRNFDRADAVFNEGVNTIIGENGSGKTNLFRAIRLLLDDDQVRWAYRLEEGDLHRGLGNWRGHWIVISIEFSEVSQEEAIQALFLHGAGRIKSRAIARATYNLIFRPNMAIRSRLGDLTEGDKAGLAEMLKGVTIADYETVFTGRSEANFTDPATYRALVGDFDAVVFPKEMNPSEIGTPLPKILSVAKEICFTFVQALRDVVSEFQGQRTNPLLTLLRGKGGDIDAAELDPITQKVKDLNQAIETLPDVGTIRTDIRQTIRDTAGETYSPASLSVRSSVPEEADRLLQSLRLFVGESEDDHQGTINELSLGGANLIFLTLKLLEFKYLKAKQACASFLLVEEPEAHIHTHIQKTLFDRITYPDTQIIYSTHSTHISEVSKIANVNILSRNGTRCEIFLPATGLDPAAIQAVERYLDAVRSNLLFAKSVILVEGDAEEILIPAMVKSVLGVSLDELGISLINIRSVGFEHVAALFHDDRIRKRCAIVTDLDACFFDTTPNPADDEALARKKRKAKNSEFLGLRRQTELRAATADNRWLSAHFAPTTFEVEFVRSGNRDIAISAVPLVYSSKGKREEATAELNSGDIGRFGQQMLTMADNQGKGWFAVKLATLVHYKVRIPEYILEAIFAVHRPAKRSILCNMAEHRLMRRATETKDPLDPAVVTQLGDHISLFRQGKIDAAAFQNALGEVLPDDVIIWIIGRP